MGFSIFRNLLEMKISVKNSIVEKGEKRGRIAVESINQFFLNYHKNFQNCLCGEQLCKTKYDNKTKENKEYYAYTFRGMLKLRYQISCRNKDKSPC